MDIQDKITTIKNLLNKNVQNGATEDEAMQAIALAQKLMSKYSLTMDDLKNDNVSVDDFIWGSMDDRNAPKKGNTFKNLVARPIAMFTDTEVVNMNVAKGKFVVSFFGYRVDVELAVYMHNMCMVAYETEWAKHKSLYGQSKGTKKIFGIGMAERIEERIVSMMPPKNKTTGTDIIVLKNQIVKNMYTEEKKMFNVVSGGLVEYDPSIEAFQHGYQSGDNVILTKEFQNKNNLGIGEE